mmetsp:Transcript_77168/g.216628  ORF Transcript_77168/g.216628 Transcript_77168/m.216628 type:complete len:244 (-) Transcript_77168:731-1462(-)
MLEARDCFGAMAISGCEWRRSRRRGERQLAASEGLPNPGQTIPRPVDPRLARRPEGLPKAGSGPSRTSHWPVGRRLARCPPEICRGEARAAEASLGRWRRRGQSARRGARRRPGRRRIGGGGRPRRRRLGKRSAASSPWRPRRPPPRSGGGRSSAGKPLRSQRLLLQVLAWLRWVQLPLSNPARQRRYWRRWLSAQLRRWAAGSSHASNKASSAASSPTALKRARNPAAGCWSGFWMVRSKVG